LRIPILYVGGRHFIISAKAENFGKAPFQGGNIKFVVTFAFGNLHIEINGKIGKIEAGKKGDVIFDRGTKFGVLSQGHALFWAVVTDLNNNAVQLSNDEGKPITQQQYGFHVHTFHSLTMGELYSLIALTVTSLAFITNIVLTILLNQQELGNFATNFFMNIPITLIIMAILAVLLFAYFAYNMKPER
jgi:hypothetical protein